MKINAFGLTHNERLSEGENNNDLNIDEKENPLVTKQFLTSPFHRDSSNRLSIQFSGESSGFVFFNVFIQLLINIKE